MQFLAQNIRRRQNGEVFGHVDARFAELQYLNTLLSSEIVTVAERMRNGELTGRVAVGIYFLKKW
jgi:hypothetical protein